VTAPDDRPTDARVVLPDGTEVPCELMFDGTDDDGIRQWTALSPLPLAPGLRFRLSTLPARTAVAVAALLINPEEN
jgi:hypothetical protein